MDCDRFNLDDDDAMECDAMVDASVATTGTRRPPPPSRTPLLPPSGRLLVLTKASMDMRLDRIDPSVSRCRWTRNELDLGVSAMSFCLDRCLEIDLCFGGDVVKAAKSLADVGSFVTTVSSWGGGAMTGSGSIGVVVVVKAPCWTRSSS